MLRRFAIKILIKKGINGIFCRESKFEEEVRKLCEVCVRHTEKESCKSPFFPDHIDTDKLTLIPLYRSQSTHNLPAISQQSHIWKRKTQDVIMDAIVRSRFHSTVRSGQA